MPTKPLHFGPPIRFPGHPGSAARRFPTLDALKEAFTCPLHNDMQTCAGPLCDFFKATPSHGTRGQILSAVCKCHAPTAAQRAQEGICDGLEHYSGGARIIENRDGAPMGYVMPALNEPAHWLPFGQDWAGKAGGQ